MLSLMSPLIMPTLRLGFGCSNHEALISLLVRVSCPIHADMVYVVFYLKNEFD